ncbi:MAG: hypothetical protein ACI4OJ_13715 [Lachnospiraceae bacterium]
MKDRAGVLAALALAGAVAGCAIFEGLQAKERWEKHITAKELPAKLHMTEEEIRNARDAYLGYSFCVMQEAAARDALLSPLMALDPKSCPRILLEFRIDSDRAQMLSSFAAGSLGSEEYQELASILQKGHDLDLTAMSAETEDYWENIAAFSADAWQELDPGMIWDDAEEKDEAEENDAPGGPWEEGDSEVASALRRYVYELVTFSGSESEDGFLVTEIPAGTSAPFYGSWEDSWSSGSLQEGTSASGAVPSSNRWYAEIFGEEESLDESGWQGGTWTDGTPQRDPNSTETRIGNRYRTRMFVEVRGFSLAQCEAMAEVVQRAVLYHTEDLFVAGDDIDTELEAVKTTTSADATLALRQKKRVQQWREARKERNDFENQKISVLNRRERRLFLALCAENPDLQRKSQETTEAKEDDPMADDTAVWKESVSGSAVRDTQKGKAFFMTACSAAVIKHSGKEEENTSPVIQIVSVSKGDQKTKAPDSEAGASSAQNEKAGKEELNVSSSPSAASFAIALTGAVPAFWKSVFQGLLNVLTPECLLWMLGGGILLGLSALICLIFEVENRKTFWCGEEVKSFTAIPLAGRLCAGVPQGQLRRDLEETAGKIADLSTFRGTKNLTLLLGEDDREILLGKAVPARREEALFKLLENRLQKSGIRLHWEDLEAFGKRNLSQNTLQGSSEDSSGEGKVQEEQEQGKKKDVNPLVLLSCREGISGEGDLWEKIAAANEKGMDILGILMLSVPPMPTTQKRTEERRLRNKIRSEQKRKRRSYLQHKKERSKEQDAVGETASQREQKTQKKRGRDETA